MGLLDAERVHAGEDERGELGGDLRHEGELAVEPAAGRAEGTVLVRGLALLDEHDADGLRRVRHEYPGRGSERVEAGDEPAELGELEEELVEELYAHLAQRREVGLAHEIF